MFIGCICNIKLCKKNSTTTLRSVDWACHQGNGGAAAVVCREVGLNVPKGNFTIDYLPHHGVLDEGEGLEDDGHVGVEDPVIVGVDVGHRLKICFIFLIWDFRLSGARYWGFLETEICSRRKIFLPRFPALLGSILTNFCWVFMLGFLWHTCANCTP